MQCIFVKKTLEFYRLPKVYIKVMKEKGGYMENKKHYFK